MVHKTRVKYRIKTKKSSRSLLKRLKRSVSKLFLSRSEPREYKPYLGKTKNGDALLGDRYSDSEKEARKKKHRRHRKSRPKTSFLKKWKKKWKRFLDSRQKKRIRAASKKKRRSTFLLKGLFTPRIKSPGPTWLKTNDESAANGTWALIKSYIPYTVNSISLFLIAYLAVYLIYQLTVLTVASRFHLDAVWNYYDLAFNDQSPRWNRFNIILVTGSGPFISLLIGVLFLRFLSRRARISKQLKLFMLWLGLHGFNLFFGAFASGVSFREGFGYVPLWLFFNVFWQIFFSLVFLAALATAGYLSVPRFLDTSYSISRITKNNKLNFLLFQFVIPWIIGGIILYLVRIPHHLPYDTANTLTLGFALLPALFNRNATHTPDYKSERTNNRVRILFMVLMVAFLLLYRIGLDQGFYVNMYYRLIFELELTPL